MIEIRYGDNLPILQSLSSSSFDLIYVDPPFNTGATRAHTTIKSIRDETGRVGFGGRRYRAEELGTQSFDDDFDDFIGFIEPRLVEARRLLADQGSLFVHLDAREVHYCKVLLDRVFGRDAQSDHHSHLLP